MYIYQITIAPGNFHTILLSHTLFSSRSTKLSDRHANVRTLGGNHAESLAGHAIAVRSEADADGTGFSICEASVAQCNA